MFFNDVRTLFYMNVCLTYCTNKVTHTHRKHTQVLIRGEINEKGEQNLKEFNGFF